MREPDISLIPDRQLVTSALADPQVHPAFAIFASARLLERWVKQAVSQITGGNHSAGVDVGLQIARDVGLLDAAQSLSAHFVRLLGNQVRHHDALPNDLDRQRCRQAMSGLADALGHELRTEGDATLPQNADVSRFFRELTSTVSGSLESLCRDWGVHPAASSTNWGEPSLNAVQWTLIERAINLERWQLADALLQRHFEVFTEDDWRPKRQDFGKVGPPCRLRALRLSRAGDALGAISFLRPKLLAAGYLVADVDAGRGVDFDWAESLSIYAGALGRASGNVASDRAESMLWEALEINRRVFAAQPWNTYPGINAVQRYLEFGQLGKAREVAEQITATLETIQRRLGTRELPMWTAFTWVQARLVRGDPSAEHAHEVLQRKYESETGPCRRVREAFEKMQRALA